MTPRELYVNFIRRAVLLILDGFDQYYKVGKHKEKDVL
jgi:hypothetical protein